MDNEDDMPIKLDDTILYQNIPDWPVVENYITATNILIGNFAYLEIFFVNPTFDAKEEVEIIYPAKNSSGNVIEFVYPIYDYGFKISTCKFEDFSGMSMCKLHFTIEKMIQIILDKLVGSGRIGTENPEADSEDEQITFSFSGHQSAQRKAFEAIINLKKYFIVVENFNPGAWGETYLKNIKTLADKGYGYPPESPRHQYRLEANKPLRRRK